MLAPSMGSTAPGQRRRLALTRVVLIVASAIVSLDARATDAPGQREAAALVSPILARLDAAWNAADGAAFAAEFTDDAEVINIFGGRLRGRPDIASRMQNILSTIFKGSRHRSRSLEVARFLTDGIVLAVSSAIVDVPAGPQAPVTQSRQSFVLENRSGVWRISHWHNTVIRPTP
jgi:uncharacterized protein (TIGR02246 family)